MKCIMLNGEGRPVAVPGHAPVLRNPDPGHMDQHKLEADGILVGYLAAFV